MREIENSLNRNHMKQLVYGTFFAFLLGSSCMPGELTPVRTVLELDLGETKEVVLTDGSNATLTLEQIEVVRDSLRGAIRDVKVTVVVNGEKTILGSGNYTLPVVAGGVQIDCPVVKGYYSNSNADRWGLTGDARFRLWPTGFSLMEPGTFVYPVRQKWFASMTQSGNEPPYVDWGENPENKNIYYHSGHDFGGAEGRDEIISAMDGVVISANGDTLEGYHDFPGDIRPDVVWVRSDLGWFIRYSHLDSTDPGIRIGTRVKKGQPIGLMGKQGGSGGWVHLHFELKTRETASGAWGTEESYAYLWEAYIKQYKPKVMAVARPHHLVWTGQETLLDGSKSKSMEGEITSYEWSFSDGSTALGPTQKKAYAEPGEYSEILKVTDSHGNVEYDFAVVQVYDRNQPGQTIPVLQPAYYPSLDIRAGDPVTFLVRTFNTDTGNEIWDFGDGTDPVSVRSEPPTHQNYTEGVFAETVHTFGKAGDYIVSVERHDSLGHRASAHLHVVVQE